jgi:hypothetical protein
MLLLLSGLKVAVHEFAAREETLNGEYRAKCSAEIRAFEAAASAQAAQASDAIACAEAGFQADRERSQARFEQRKRRINEAHFSSRKRALEEIRQQEGRVRYKVQEGTLGAERRRETDLATMASVHQELHAKLAQSREAFAVLERAARAAFRGYGKFRRLLSRDSPITAPDLSADEDQLLGELDELRARTRDGIGRFRKRILPSVFRFFPAWLQILLLLMGLAFLYTGADRFRLDETSRREIGISFFTAWAVLAAVRQLAQRQANPAARAIATDLVKARWLHETCVQTAESRSQQEQQRIQGELETTTHRLDQDWKRASRRALDMLDARPKEIDDQAPRVAQKSEQLHRRKLGQIERDYTHRIAQLQQDAEAYKKELAADREAKLARLSSEHQNRWQELEAQWKQRIEPIYETIRTANATANELFPEWQMPLWQKWTPPQEFKNAARFGRLDVDTADFFESVPKDKRLSLPGSGTFSVPLLLRYPQAGSILFETTNTGAEPALAAINNVIFRLLSTTPPGKLSFTIFDPVGLGQNFAGLMHLADYEESHINSRIWTQTGQLEEKLAELNAHMEKVIQMYLRNEYETIAEYNAQAGTIAEKYHFLVISDFPVNFTDTAARRLINIATSGARCGVYTLIHWDRRHALPPGFVPEELRKNSIRVVRTGERFEMEGHTLAGTRLTLDSPPPPELATHFLHEIGRSSKDSNRVEVPFAQVAPPDSELWSEDTSEELQVPIGRSGATKLQYLEIGKGTRQHALVAGKTGSGKSTLFHVIISNLALWCSPEQVEFYLVDFKKGVEFKCYATHRLPHAKVVAIESDRQFGLSVLQRVDEELRRRGDLFRKLGVQDLPGYKRAGGTEPMPRSLLIIDEFQEFFVEEDRVSQYAAVLLDRIVRQGRAFGIHVLLGSQTLGGAYTLARATIGQMVIRIALQCSEADAYLIMDQDNPAPRLLSRPGEGIYNDAAGSIEGNSPFQTVWLPEHERDRYLAKVRERADQDPNPPPGPFVFEGNAPADVRENGPLRELIEANSVKPAAQARIWLGAPNSIKGPTEAVFRRQSGSNLLIVGQSEERALTLLSLALVSLAAQYPKDTVRLVLLDSTPPGFPQREFLRQTIEALPHEIIQANSRNLTEVMTGLAGDLTQRTGDEKAEAPETFLLIHGLQNYKKLKQEDEFSFSGGDGGKAMQPAAVLQNLISDGPGRGLHVIATCDTYNNVNRFLGRKTMSEFEMRVLFQMSASDSASLIDAPDASTLGLHRALYYNDREGYIETFRPYALPGNEWIEEVARRLGRVRAK